MSPSASTAPSARGPEGPAPEADAGLKVSTSPRPGSRLAVEVGVPAERCQASYEAALAQLSRSVRLPGFRKGRVPRPVLLQQIGPLRIRATALEELVDSAFRDALAQEELAVLGRPELTEAFDALLERFAPDDELTFTLEVDVAPTPSLRTTRGLRAEAEPVAYDPARLDELLEQSRRQLATLVPVEGRPAAAGDVAQVSFRGTYADDDSAIEGGSSDGMEVDLEEGRMIPGFVEGILGMEVGQTRTIECRFPADYPQKEAAGRPARFALTLLELKSRELPALDDEFARQASDKSSLAELREELEQRLRDDAERRHRSNRQDALLAALVEELEVELPRTLIDQEVRRLLEQTATEMARQGMDVKKLFSQDVVRSLMDTSRPEAMERLRRSLALQALAAAEGIEVAEERLQERLEEVRRDLDQAASVDPERLREAVREDLLRETLLGWLEENSTIVAPEPESQSEAQPGAPADAPAPAETAAGTAAEAASPESGQGQGQGRKKASGGRAAAGRAAAEADPE